MLSLTLFTYYDMPCLSTPILRASFSPWILPGHLYHGPVFNLARSKIRAVFIRCQSSHSPRFAKSSNTIVRPPHASFYLYSAPAFAEHHLVRGKSLTSFCDLISILFSHQR